MSLVYNDLPFVTPAFVLTRIDSANNEDFSGKTVRLTGYEIIWIRSGTCFLESNLKAYTLQQGTVCCFAPGQVRKTTFSKSTQALHLALAPGFFYPLCVEAKFPLITIESHHLGRPMIINLNQEAEDELHDIIQNVQKEIVHKHEDSTDVRDMWMRLFLMYLRRHISSRNLKTTGHRETELVTHFLELLAKNFTTKKMVSDYAGELRVTPNYLNLVVKKVSGFSASHHIQQFIILEAKRQAMASVKSMKEIAYGLGFDDIAHFSKFFKNKSGSNFTDFKRHWSGVKFHS